MSLQRTCYFCGAPVSVRRHMSLFCSERCETRHRYLSRALTGVQSAPEGAAERWPGPPLGPPSVPPSVPRSGPPPVPKARPRARP
jgi:hypothetical protein